MLEAFLIWRDAYVYVRGGGLSACKISVVVQETKSGGSETNVLKSVCVCGGVFPPGVLVLALLFTLYCYITLQYIAVMSMYGSVCITVEYCDMLHCSPLRNVVSSHHEHVHCC